MATISVTIDGKVYRMACEPGQEEYLQGLAENFDQRVRHLRSSFGEIGDLRLTVMAGLMLVDELTEVEKQKSRLQKEVLAINQAQSDELQPKLEEMMRRVRDLTNKLAQQTSNNS